MFKSDFFRAWGRTEGDCCFLARAEKDLVFEGWRRCFRIRPGEEGADDIGSALSAGEGTNPISEIWPVWKG